MSEVFTLSKAERAALEHEHARNKTVIGVTLSNDRSVTRISGILARVVAAAEASETIGRSMEITQTLPGPATLIAIRDREQGWRDVAERYGLLTSHDAAKMAGSTAKNPSEWASQRVRSGRLIAVTRSGRNLFPGFQFDERGQERRGLQPILTAFADADWDSESIVLWFTAPNGYLGHRDPADLIAEAPDAVLEAALNATSPL